MTADIINLRRARKQKARGKAEVAARENRIVFGESKVEKTKRKALITLAEKRLDQTKLEAPVSNATEAFRLLPENEKDSKASLPKNPEE